MKLKILTLLIVVLSFVGCNSTPEINPKVCETGQLICDIGTTVCNQFPLPQTVCSYLNIACTNINLLCETEPGTVAYMKAANELQKATKELNQWLKLNKVTPGAVDSTNIN